MAQSQNGTLKSRLAKPIICHLLACLNPLNSECELHASL
uniref:Uncharacterized protein n=1 Tax=Pseudomonas aeruginosa TaxID=287 RepID=A0A5P9W9T5_PSEAI|nr:hypothetical protein pNK546KPC_0006 [Pseudomonas aeruginosa]QLG05258.1 hypothetical protein [Pseudomonas aeruginosa]UGK55987.1 Hypothetical protein [Pseudomonas aeruginosa]